MMSVLRNFFLKVGEEFGDIRFAAGSLAFSTLFAMVPFLIVILAFFQAFGGLEQYYPQVENLLLSSLKEATGSTVTQYLKTTINQVQAKTLGITGLFFLLFSTLGLFRNIDVAFHKIWKIKIKKPFYSRMWLYSLILMSTPILLAAFIGLRSVDYVKVMSQSVEHQFLFSIWLTFFLWVLYIVIPDTKVSRIASIVSAIAASAALSVVQGSFLWISLKIFKQNKIYGSLASFPIFLLWLLVVWYVVLCGVSLCAFLQQKIFKRP
jgi:membrane protein